MRVSSFLASASPAALAVVLTAVAPPAAAQNADQATTVDAIIVTGSRGQPRTVATSPSPIDVIGATQLETIGRDGLQEALNALLPSYNLPAMTGSGTGGVVRAAGLRGLNADQVLILVNGKRRHNSALLQSSSWTNSGSAPVDMDLIPAGAISHIEVLRDGASAQYGSDAISGVINVILKDADHGGRITAGWGSNYEGDGDTWSVSAGRGFALPNEGSLYLNIEHRRQQNYTRGVPATRFGFDENWNIVPVAVEVINQGYGNPKTETTNLAFNAELPVNEALDLYAFGTFSDKEGWKHGNFRQPTANGNIIELYPDGKSLKLGIDQRDHQLTIGGRGRFQGWDTDLSTSYSHDDVKQLTTDSLNPSLGPDSPTDFYLGSQIFTQWTTNLDLTRAFDTGLARPTQVSWGLEHRYEEWKLTPGEELSYLDGGYVFPRGPYAGQITNRSTGVRGVSPDDAGADNRNVYAAYVDVGFYPTDRWYAAVALRHERYDDSAGDTTNGKLTTRYEFTPNFALRATASTGFRAPSLAQSIYQQSTVSAFQATADGYVQYYLKFLSPESELGQLLGARPLTPEKSENYSLGFTWTPLSNATLTVDAYQIDVKDRIVRSGNLAGREVVAILEQHGLKDFNGAAFYTNAVDTRTRGVDVVGEYRADYGRFGQVRWNASYNYNKTEIQDIKDLVTPGTNYQVFDHSAQVYLERGNPRQKLILGGDWRLGAIGANLRATRYGDVTQPGNTSALDRTFTAKWIVDLKADYNFANGVNLTVGANNLLDQYPDKVGVLSNTGLGAYGYISPFGFGGGYYYTRLSYSF